MNIAKNIQIIKEKVWDVCVRVSRCNCDITTMAVTKTVPAELVKEALDAGITDIGESKIQEAQNKFLLLPEELAKVKKHLIGHLQTNKVKRAVELFDVIQSVDSQRLAQEIHQQAQKLGKVQECLLELKVSGEDSKFGFLPDELEASLKKMAALSHIRICGLMTMAPYAGDPEKARPYFKRAKKIFDDINAGGGTPRMTVLSMGMSGDFEVAIEEGSTMLRLGSAIFGEREY
ncbi:MAG: YggS family pyridoxal phosphate-dependent enzyme [Endomicrobiales bacterium]